MPIRPSLQREDADHPQRTHLPEWARHSLVAWGIMHPTNADIHSVSKIVFARAHTILNSGCPSESLLKSEKRELAAALPHGTAEIVLYRNRLGSAAWREIVHAGRFDNDAHAYVIAGRRYIRNAPDPSVVPRRCDVMVSQQDGAAPALEICEIAWSGNHAPKLFSFTDANDLASLAARPELRTMVYANVWDIAHLLGNEVAKIRYGQGGSCARMNNGNEL